MGVKYKAQNFVETEIFLISTRGSLLCQTPQSPPNVPPKERVSSYGGLVQYEEERRVDESAAQRQSPLLSSTDVGHLAVGLNISQ